MPADVAALGEEIGNPVAIDRPDGQSDVLLVCEHASNTIPPSLAGLGLSPETQQSHIAWDPGALAVAKHVSETLDATLIHQRFSRLVYDCNRPPDAPSAMPARSEVFDIPGNAVLGIEDRIARARALYLPFHAAVAEAIAMRQAQDRATVLVTMHSFTPVYHGKPRAVELGLLHDQDSRLVDRMLAASGDAPYRTERNAPYGPADGVTHTLKLHALPTGLLNVMVEIRNDLIADGPGQRALARHLVGLLETCIDG